MNSCKYHPDRHSSWNCSRCHTDFCTTCFPGGSGNFGVPGPKCPLCLGDLEYQGDGREKEPFWRISHRFFSYPFQFQTLLLSVLMLVAGSSMLFGLMGLVITLLMVAMFFRYGFLVIESLASNDWEAPPALSAIGGSDHLILKMMVVILASGFAVGFLGHQSEFMGIIANGFVSLAMPACIMVMAMTRSMSAALNPIRLTQLMIRVGWSYLLLWFSLSIVWNGPFLIVWMMDESSSVLWATTFWILSSAYFGLVAYAMMGYTIYSRSHELGVSDFMEQGELLEPAQYEIKQALGFSFIYMWEQRRDQAMSTLQLALNKYPNDLRLLEQMLRLLLLGSSAEKIASHAEKYYRALDTGKNAGRAAVIYDELSSKIKGYRPARPHQRFQIAEFFGRTGKYPKVIALLHDFEQWQGYPGVQAAAVLLARAYTESGEYPKKAAYMIRYIDKHFAGTPAAREATELKRLLESTSQPTAKSASALQVDPG